MRMDAVRQAWNDLPLVDLEGLLQGRLPLILAPHPDDETLGCGGLIAQLCAAGTPPHVAIMTDGSHSHPNSKTHTPERLRHMREEEARSALRLLGLPVGQTWFLGHEDNEDLPVAGPAYQFAARRLSGICETHGCQVIIAPWRHDGLQDHEATATLAEHVALRDDLGLIFYPINGWSMEDAAVVEEAQPRGWRLDISGEIALKEKAIMAHASQYAGIITDDCEHIVCQKLMAAARRPIEVYLAA